MRNHRLSSGIICLYGFRADDIRPYNIRSNGTVKSPLLISAFCFLLTLSGMLIPMIYPISWRKSAMIPKPSLWYIIIRLSLNGISL